MQLAQSSLIDGFALSVSLNDASTSISIQAAFSAAEAKKFLLFISFDYTTNERWSPETITPLIRSSQNSTAYFRPDGVRPLVTTTGSDSTAHTADWVSIQSDTKLFFPT